MNKKTAHLQVFGYEPLRMKPAHFASGFFIALTGKVFKNELLNQVAVVKANRGLLGNYQHDAVVQRLANGNRIAEPLRADEVSVEQLRIQVNGVVNNDHAMYPAFSPYKPKGNDYTFISPRLLTNQDRTDGYAGFLVASVLNTTNTGKLILNHGRGLAKESAQTLEHFVTPLLDKEVEANELNLEGKYKEVFGSHLTNERLGKISRLMALETDALLRLCENFGEYSHYKRVRFYVLGLLAWLTSYLLKTSSTLESNPLLFFDFSGSKSSRTRFQSVVCYARMRETVGQAYEVFSETGKFSPDPVKANLFTKKSTRGKHIENDHDFSFLEQHFSRSCVAYWVCST